MTLAAVIVGAVFVAAFVSYFVMMRGAADGCQSGRDGHHCNLLEGHAGPHSDGTYIWGADGPSTV